MKQSTLDRFKTKLLDMRRRLIDQVDNIHNNSLSRRDDAAGEVSDMPIHMADVASDTFEKEFALDLIESEHEELREIDDALGRLAEGSFGICEMCEGPVGYHRLTAIAFARLCIECKRKEEEEGV